MLKSSPFFISFFSSTSPEAASILRRQQRAGRAPAGFPRGVPPDRWQQDRRLADDKGWGADGHQGRALAGLDCTATLWGVSGPWVVSGFVLLLWKCPVSCKWSVDLSFSCERCPGSLSAVCVLCMDWSFSCERCPVSLSVVCVLCIDLSFSCERCPVLLSVVLVCGFVLLLWEMSCVFVYYLNYSGTLVGEQSAHQRILLHFVFKSWISPHSHEVKFSS